MQLLITKPDGTILSSNLQACTLLGMTEAEIVTAGREGIAVKNEKLFTDLKEREQRGKARGQLTFRKKDGKTVLVDVTSNVFADKEGELKTIMILREAQNE